MTQENFESLVVEHTVYYIRTLSGIHVMSNNILVISCNVTFLVFLCYVSCSYVFC